MVLKTLLVKIGADVSDFTKKMNDVSSKLEANKKKIQGSLKKISLAVVGIGVASLKASIDFNKSMSNVATLIPGNIKRVESLKTSVQDMSMTFGKSTQDISDGLYQVISAFGDSADTVKILETNVRAACAGMAATTDAINLTSAVTKGYGDITAKAVEKAADLAFLTVKLGQTTFPQLANAIGNVVPIAAKLNVSQEELFATFSALTGVTGDASRVSTQLSGVLGAMIKPTEAMTTAIGDLGFESSEAMVKELGMVGALNKLIGTTDGTAAAVGKLISRKEALTAAFALTGGAADDFHRKLGIIQKEIKKGGTLDTAFKEISEGINEVGFNMSRLKQTVIVLAQRLGGQLAPVIGKLVVSAKPLVEKLIALIEGFSKLPGPIKAIVLGLGGLMAALGPLSMMLPGLVTGFGLLGPAIGAMLGPIGLVVSGLALLATGIVVIFRSAIEEEKKWLDNSVLINAALDSMSVNMEKTRLAAGMSKKEWEKLRKEYDKDDMALARAIEKGKEGVLLQNAQIKVSRELRAAKEKQRKKEEELKVVTEGLTAAQKKQIETQEKLREATINAARAHYEQKQSLAELYGLTVDIPPKIKDIGTASETVGGIIGGSLGKIIDSTGKVGKEFDFLSATWNTNGKKIQTTSEKVAAGLIKTGKKASKETEKTWATSLSGLGGIFRTLSDNYDGVMGQLLSSTGSAFDIVGTHFKKLSEGADVSFKDLAGTIAPVLGQIGGSIGQMISGAKKSFAGLGASLGGMVGNVFGPVGKAVGSVLGGIIGGLFKMKKAETAAEKAARILNASITSTTRDMSKYGKITEDTAKKITESRKSMEGWQAVSKHFGDIIRDVGVTQENVNKLWSRATDIIHHYTDGSLSASDATNALDESFQLLMEGAQKLGKEGSKAMIEFIQKVRESGLEVASVTEYVINQLDRIPSALETLIASQEKTGQSIKSLESKTLEVFKAMEASGMSWSEIIHKMSPSLNALRERMKEMGHTGSAAIRKLFKIAEVTEKNKELFNAIEADKTILEALGNTGFLTGEVLNSFARDAVGNYEALKTEFGNSNDALRAMGPTLQKIKDYADAYNITLDEGTQKLIDQAEELGVVKEKQESVQEVAEKGFADMKGVLTEIRDLLGGMGDRLKGSGIYQKLKDVDLVSKKTWENMKTGLGSVISKIDDVDTKFDNVFTDAETAARKAGENINDAIGKIQPHVEIDFKYKIPEFDKFVSPSGKGEVAEFQEGGIAWRKQLAVVGETPELITPLKKIREAGRETMRGGAASTFNPEINLKVENKLEPIIIQRDNEIIIKIVKDGFQHGQLTVPVKAVGG